MMPNSDPATWAIPPTPAAIKAAREEAGLTQMQAGAVLYCAERTWQDWERGRRAMMPALFEHFCAKNADQKADQTTQNNPINQPANENGINISC